jgi:hypothetical protein
MTAIQSARFRPDSRIIRDLAWRAVLVVLASAGVLLDVPAWARVPLSVAAAVVTLLFFLGRSRTRGPIDANLTALAIVIVVLMLLGVILNVLPAGITRVGWGIGVGLAELVALLLLAFWRAPKPVVRTVPRVRLSAVVWALAVAAVLIGALSWSVASFDGTHVSPLVMDATGSGRSVVVTVSSGRDVGPYLLQSVKGSTRTTIARDIRIGPKHPGSITITVPANTREKLQLVRSGSTTPVRELIVDTTTNTTKVTR